MKKHYLNELIVNIGIFAVLAVFASQAPLIIEEARTIPLIYIYTSAALNLAMFIINFVKYRKCEAAAGESRKNVLLAIVAYVFIIGVYVFCMKYISYILSTLLFILGSLLFLKVRNKWLLIILPLVLTFVLYYMFTRYLGVFPPSGTLITLKWY